MDGWESDVGLEGTWRCVTGEKWGFSHWREGEPNNDSSGSGTGKREGYIILWGNETALLDGGAAYWNDLPNNGGLLARDGYVLERGYWTDANDSDTDDDGLSDGEESAEVSSYELVKSSFSWDGARADAQARGREYCGHRNEQGVGPHRLSF